MENNQYVILWYVPNIDSVLLYILLGGSLCDSYNK